MRDFTLLKYITLIIAVTICIAALMIVSALLSKPLSPLDDARQKFYITCSKTVNVASNNPKDWTCN